MPSVDIPPEVWSRIFFFVAPPLPYVGMEDESLVEDAKEWRGDELVKGRWKDIDNLMLVSKKLNELVSPIFWSFLVVKSASRAQTLGELSQGWSSHMREAIFDLVKVVHLPNQLGREGEKWLRNGNLLDYPVILLLRCLPRLQHIHLLPSPCFRTTSAHLFVSLATRSLDFRPVQGLTGLAVGSDNYEAVTLALRRLSPHLRRLSVFTQDSSAPFAVIQSSSGTHLVAFPSLVSLVVGSYDTFGLDDLDAADEGDEPWLESTIQEDWQMPALTKLAVGAAQTHVDLALGRQDWVFASDDETAYRSVFVMEYSLVSGCLESLAGRGLDELAFGFRRGSAEQEMSFVRFKAYLDEVRWPTAGTIKRIVIVEGRYKSTAVNQWDVCLAELVSKKRFPSLEKVVWVSHQRDADYANWSGVLLRWTLALTKSGVDVEVR